MDWSLLSILTLGFLMGIKHAIEPDHMIAVSTIASRSRSLWRSSLAGVFWGVGHTATLFAVGLVLLLMKKEIPDVWALSLEFVVGLMLVYLGVRGLAAFRGGKVHAHRHTHDGVAHDHFHSHAEESGHEHHHVRERSFYLKSVLVGFVHGLAGSAAMFVMTMEAVSHVWQGLAYILIFGAGTVLGMLLFTTLLGVPFVWSSGKPALNRLLTGATGAVSTVFGVFYMYEKGVTDGLFRLWLS